MAPISDEGDLPPASDPSRVGMYSGLAKAGGGLVWDAVLEYRVWCHPDYFHAFATYEDAVAYSRTTCGAEEPLALVLQEEHIDEPEPGRYVHVKESRVTEWPVTFLRRPRRTASTIPDFLADDAPSNRLDILRGLT